MTVPNISDKYKYVKLSREDTPEGRFYLDPQGNRLPSVTSILSATKDTKFLDAWKKRVGEQKALEIRNQAADYGTLIHSHLECYLKGEERPGGNNYIRSHTKKQADIIIEKGISKIDEVFGIESSLYYPNLYAGTTDLVASYNGKESIVDFKNSIKIKKREWIKDYFDQLCAYIIAHDEVHKSNIQQGVILMVDREFNFETFILEGDELKFHKDNFMKKVEIYNEQKSSGITTSISS